MLIVPDDMTEHRSNAVHSTHKASYAFIFKSYEPFGAHTILRRVIVMETRVAVVAIIVENNGSVAALNGILHDYSEYIIGRMGLPYRQKSMNIISVVVDAPHDVVNALSGKIEHLDGVNAKTVYSK